MILRLYKILITIMFAILIIRNKACAGMMIMMHVKWLLHTSLKAHGPSQSGRLIP